MKNSGRLNSAHGRQTACSLNGKMEPARGHAPRYRSYQDRTSLSMICRLGPGGRTCTSVALTGCAFTARRNCCCSLRRRSAHPSRCSGLRHLRAAALRLPHLDEYWALGRDSHPRPSPYEGAALTAAPPSEILNRSRRRAALSPLPTKPLARRAAFTSPTTAEMVEAVGLAPTACRLRAGCSAIELRLHGCRGRVRTCIHGFKVRCPTN